MVGCKHQKLNPPRPNVFIPIVEQVLCDDSGNCSTLSMCKEFTINSKGKFEKVADHELKKCHGTIGVTAKEYQAIVNYQKEVSIWIGRNCNGSYP